MPDNRARFRPGSKHERIAEALSNNDMDVSAAMVELSAEIGSKPMLFERNNDDGDPQPLPIGSLADDERKITQHGRALFSVIAVKRAMIHARTIR